MKICKFRLTSLDCNGNHFQHNCGSYAFNLHKEGHDQKDFCDVHFWQDKYTNLKREVDLFGSEQKKRK